MTELGAIEFLRILIPDLALFWKTVYSGLWALRIPDVILLMAWILVFIGFAVTIYEIILTQSLAPLGAKALRLAVAAFVVGYYPTLVGDGTNPTSSAAWKAFHGIYGSLYVGKDSFYARWAVGNGDGPIPQAMKKLVSAYKELLKVRAAIITVDLGTHAMLQSLGVTCTAAGFIMGGTPLLGVAVGALCGAAERLKGLIKDADRIFAQADNYMLISIMAPVGAHALIIYTTLAIFISVVFLSPIFASFLLFRGLERIFPTMVGLYFASFLALGVSAVAFAATTNVLYNALASIWERMGLEINQELRNQLQVVEKQTKVEQGLLTQYRTFTNQLEAQAKALEGTLASINSYLDANGNLKATPWPKGMVAQDGSIQYLRTEVMPAVGNNPPSLRVENVSCPGTQALPGTNYASIEGAVQSCLTEVKTRLKEQRDYIDTTAQRIAQTYESVVDKLVSKLARIKMSLLILLMSSITLTIVLTTAMITLVIRVVGVVQGFQLGRGLPMGGGMPR